MAVLKCLYYREPREPINKLLSETICFNSMKLNICQASFSNYRDKRANLISYDNIKTAFNVETTFDCQLMTLLDKISLTDEEIRRFYEPVCQELEKIFKPIFPKCKVYKFGSTTVGLGFKNCDLDIYLNPGLPVVEENRNSGPHILSLDLLFSIVERTIHNNQSIFSSCCPIRNAKMPIIKFMYRQTKVLCDISFKNNLAVYNSQLVKFYLSIDPRFQPTMMILKYWIYNCDLRSSIRINKYALTMLFIFYLQQIKLVPPIIDLKHKCSVPVTVKGWQINFNKTLTNFQMNCRYKNESIPKLLQGFFDFYMNYDFESNVVCPNDGHSYNKEIFNDIECLPPSMIRYKEYVEDTENALVLSTFKPMCVQDPNELNQNLTANICCAQLEKFQTYCSIAASITKNSSNNDYQNLLKDLFNFTSNQMRNTHKANQKNFIFLLQPTALFGENTDTNILKKDLCIKNNWFDLTLFMIKQYLTEVLNFEVKPINIDKLPDQQKFKDQSSVNSRSHQKIVLHCKGIHQLWSNRQNKKIIDNTLSPLQKEIEISKIILKQKSLENDLNIIEFECHIEKQIKPSEHILLSLLDKGCSKKIFSEIVNHLTHKMLSVINKTFKCMTKSEEIKFK